MFVSYLSDALGDLASAVEDILLGRPDARASFLDEPGEYRWRLRRLGEDRIEIRIIESAEWGGRNDEAGKVILHVECGAGEFATVVVQELRRLLQAHGPKRYRKEWVHHDFPLARLRSLENLLANRA